MSEPLPDREEARNNFDLVLLSLYLTIDDYRDTRTPEARRYAERQILDLMRQGLTWGRILCEEEQA